MIATSAGVKVMVVPLQVTTPVTAGAMVSASRVSTSSGAACTPDCSPAAHWLVLANRARSPATSPILGWCENACRMSGRSMRSHTCAAAANTSSTDRNGRRAAICSAQRRAPQQRTRSFMASS